MRLTRTRVAAATIALLLALDLARSIYARTTYARPVDLWQPRATVYADLAWPPGADMPATTPPGARVYAQRCAVCHGPDGRGNGPAAPSMIPRPRDFTLGLFRYKSTPAGQPPTDQDLEHTVANGLPASAMPYFRDLLSGDDIRAVVAHVKTLSHAFEGAAPAPIAVPAPTANNAASVERGRRIYAAQGCPGCHGPDGRKGGFLQDAKNYPATIRDLTAPWTFRGGSDPNQVWLRLTTGLAGSSMPSYGTALSPDERWDVVRYVESLARVAPWETGGRLEGRGQQADLIRRGEYLVHAEMCGLCHTQVDKTGIYRGDDFYLAGGMRVGAYPHGMFVTRNLTGDADTGLGRWSEAQIVNAFRNGRAPDRVLNLWGMPWFYFHYFANDDATAIARYLKVSPPVRNRIPPALHYGVVETIASKLTRPLPAVIVTLLTYEAGNFAQTMPGPLRGGSQDLFIDAQWVVLAVGVLAFVFVAWRDRLFPRWVGGWVLLLLGTAVLVVLGVALWAIYELPALSVIPPEQIVNGATAGIPAVDPSRFKTPEERALAERGHYLYTVASCAFCHKPNGSGGLKLSWRGVGTMWSRNITSDVRTGIGTWSEAEIMRAMRSGISRNGRVLHWQGMPWDHLSNWDEEDAQALVTYVRTLPPVAHDVPATLPPAPDDCETYTFWVSTNELPGCR